MFHDERDMELQLGQPPSSHPHMLKRILLGTLMSAALGTAAQAQVLDFEGIHVAYPSPSTPALNGFYNGGTSSVGTSGANYGITFSSNALAICLNEAGISSYSCSNTSRGGLGNPASARTGLFFLDGSQTYMNRSAGFTNGFSFYYAAVNNPRSFSVWSGENGTGTLLGSLTLGTTTSACTYSSYNASFCPFTAAGLAFSGVAKSVTFAGVANQIVFDDVTFGNSTPGTTVPEPSTYALMAAGLAAMGVVARRRRQS